MGELALDFAGMGAALTDADAMRRQEHRSAVLQQYRVEIAALLIGLRGAQVIGRNEIPADAAEDCDLCSQALKAGQLYVDGAVNQPGGMWANMCISCFAQHGRAIGWGSGQLYSYDGNVWHCIGGGNPAPCNAEEE